MTATQQHQPASRASSTCTLLGGQAGVRRDRCRGQLQRLDLHRGAGDHLPKLLLLLGSAGSLQRVQLGLQRHAGAEEILDLLLLPVDGEAAAVEVAAVSKQLGPQGVNGVVAVANRPVQALLTGNPMLEIPEGQQHQGLRRGHLYGHRDSKEDNRVDEEV